MSPMKNDDFYLRFYAEKKGKNGQDFLEVEFHQDGRMSYAYASRKKEQSVVRREAFVTKANLDQLKRLVADSGLTRCPARSFVSRVPDSHQELEISLDGNAVLLSPEAPKSSSSSSSSLSSLAAAAAREGSTRKEDKRAKMIAHNFNAVVNDVKCLFFSLVGTADYKVETF